MGAVFVWSPTPSLCAELVGFGKAAGAATYALAFTDAEADSIRNCGAEGVVRVRGDEQVIENNARGIARLLDERGVDVFLAAATPSGRDLAARIAGYRDCGMASDVASLVLEGDVLKAECAVFGGAAMEELTIELPAVATVPSGRFDAACAPAPVEEVTIEVDDRVSLVGTTPIVKQGCDLSSAKSIVACGLGIAQQEDMQIVEDLADALGAELGCTRGIAEERHWLPIEQYVGLSGVSVSPDLYLTVGVSGQVQHVAGVRDSKIVVAIDKNPDAPIFKACDYGIVGDLYEVVPLLANAVRALN